jgi:hypothetical protein
MGGMCFHTAAFAVGKFLLSLVDVGWKYLRVPHGLVDLAKDKLGLMYSQNGKQGDNKNLATANAAAMAEHASQ